MIIIVNLRLAIDRAFIPNFKIKLNLSLSKNWLLIKLLSKNYKKSILNIGILLKDKVHSFQILV